MKTYDVVVIGSGPAGQKASIQCAKAGKRVVVCEQLREVGGACVQYGTIPSKALRERAVLRAQISRQLADMKVETARETMRLSDLIGEVGDVVASHDRYMTEQLTRNGVEIIHGRLSFVDPHTARVRYTDGNTDQVRAEFFVIASGSRPRHPENVPIDHESIYDSDSVLTLSYLPRSMVVLGGGVIASEYASIFAMLGVEVTMIDRFARPLGFLDPDLADRFLARFESAGGHFIGEANIEQVAFDGISEVETRLGDGTVITADKVLCAMGRVAQIDGLGIDKTGIQMTNQLIAVDANGQTSVPHIYAAGDVVGPPSLASASMEQGRRAACHLLGLDAGHQGDWIPTGIYAVPELASVGLTEPQVKQEYGAALTGFAHFKEIARGHIAGRQSGMLKLVVSPDQVVRGVHVVGEHATDLVHIGQMGLIYGATVDVYVENIFNFPTFAESYRVAALQVTGKSSSARRVA